MKQLQALSEHLTHCVVSGGQGSGMLYSIAQQLLGDYLQIQRQPYCTLQATHNFVD